MSNSQYGYNPDYQWKELEMRKMCANALTINSVCKNRQNIYRMVLPMEV